MIDIINYNGEHQDEIVPYVGPGAFNDPDMVKKNKHFPASAQRQKDVVTTSF